MLCWVVLVYVGVEAMYSMDVDVLCRRRKGNSD